MPTLPRFKNEPIEDFSILVNRTVFEKAIKKAEHELGKEYPLLINGARITTSEKIISINPSDPKEIIGIVQKATTTHAEKAIKAAAKAFESWRFVPAEKRASYLLKAANIMKKRKFELAAIMVLEVGKNWTEAVADMAEAIDFLEFYAREMLRLAKPIPTTNISGEKDIYTYIPLGVGVVISPWNFPAAILAGMTVAAIVTGNTVVVKPASATVVIAAKFVEIMQEVGLPPGVLNFITGTGEAIGDYLVDHRLTRFITFTGSKDVGLRIIERAAKVHHGQKWIKRVAAEMGGKDALLIDSEADIDLAVEATAVSAYGFGGQKCSACSRVIVDKKVYDTFIKKLIERIKKITVGNVKEYGTYLGPVVTEGARGKILSYIAIGKQEAKLITGGNKLDRTGYFIEPTVFVDVPWNARIAQEEIFGPVLSVIKAENFEDALRIANSTEYGLTGGIITRNRKKIERAKKEFYVGNLYINRKITGALVDVHPFGGYNMSGTCAKAGGRDYLLLFLQGKSIAEKIF